jgi:hypothetical protein
MTPSLVGVLPTRLVDLSGSRLRDLRRLDPQYTATVCAPLVREVSAPATVTLAGSDS